MVKLLHISASPKGERSTSGRLAEAFLAAYAKAHPQDEIARLNVFEADLPRFGKEHAEAKFAPIFGEERTPAQNEAWASVLATITQFDAADKILLSTPMWNFSIPWALKLYLDCLAQPQVTFGYDREKQIHFGKLANRPVQFILTRSSILPGDFGDFQLPYLKFMFEFMGLRDIRVIAAWQTTKPSAREREEYLKPFIDLAAQTGGAF